VAAEALEGRAIVGGDHDASVEQEVVAPGAQAIAAAHDPGGGGGRRMPGRRGLGLDLREQLGWRIGGVGGRSLLCPT
jgi:hypothetical protein